MSNGIYDTRNSADYFKLGDIVYWYHLYPENIRSKYYMITINPDTNNLYGFLFAKDPNGDCVRLSKNPLYKADLTEFERLLLGFE